MKKIRVALKGRSYDIVIGPGLFKKTGMLLKKLGLRQRDAVIVTNRRILDLCGRKLAGDLKKRGFTVTFLLVPDSEKAKSGEVAISLLNRIADYDKYRRLFLIALGGGVVGDLTGFVASIYKRGVPYVQIPTTLLGQVDSSIGGKTAIDLPAAKNLAGAFYQPKIVICDTSILKSLPRRQLKSGLAEIIKYGVIKDRGLFEYIEKNYARMLSAEAAALEFAIARSAKIKAEVVSRDELDTKGLRVILNYGHTTGHAIESAGAYSGQYDHGEGVAIGMAAAADMASALKMISPGDAGRIKALIKKCGLPLRAKGLSVSKIYGSIAHDKKFIRGRNRLVLPAGIGKVRVVEGVPERVIKEAIKGEKYG
ncbi:MAG: 3-dehydroquinate synthase [Candidatus Omnitrophica bacterium]|nr:3-dehydroquinate synthase [Candidatus Omnitrophota bacterium]MDD5436963.1 3-dehydroquinate synthase [Candidatus Omnitrophota bacterium]